MKTTVLFRADGSTQMGLGHLYRSAALSAMLTDFHCVLVTAAPEKVIGQTICSAFSLIHHLTDADPRTFLAKLAEFGDPDATIIVLDGYHFTTEIQQQLAAHVSRVVAIDDIHAYPFVCDLVINHSPVRHLRPRYELAGGTTLAHGLPYSLLRQPFLRVARERLYRGGAGRFFICFGGSDAKNITGKLISWLTELGYERPLDVVLGPANPNREAVLEVAALYPGEVTLHQSLGDAAMIELYLTAELAFLPASTTLLEALAVGVPTVIGYYVDNQVDIYRGFIQQKLSRGVGDWNAPEGLGECIGAALRTALHPRPRPIDGYADVNLNLLFAQLAAKEELLLSRPAEAEDARQYFEWVNEAMVRQNSIDTRLIAWEDHLAWFTKKVEAEDSLLLYFSNANGPCGQLRYDLENGVATIDISLDKRQRGRGLATRMLALGKRQLSARHPLVKHLDAYVKVDNVASARTFLNAGFAQMAGQEGQSLLHFRYEITDRQR